MTAVGVLLLSGRSETICGRRGDGRDERFRQVDIHATALAGITVILAIIIAFLVELAKGKASRRTAGPAQSAASPISPRSSSSESAARPNGGDTPPRHQTHSRPAFDSRRSTDVICEGPASHGRRAYCPRPRLRLCYAQSSHAIVVAPNRRKSTSASWPGGRDPFHALAFV
jgi:hypothetical protein